MEDLSRGMIQSDYLQISLLLVCVRWRGVEGGRKEEERATR